MALESWGNYGRELGFFFLTEMLSCAPKRRTNMNWNPSSSSPCWRFKWTISGMTNPSKLPNCKYWMHAAPLYSANLFPSSIFSNARGRASSNKTMWTPPEPSGDRSSSLRLDRRSARNMTSQKKESSSSKISIGSYRGNKKKNFPLPKNKNYSSSSSTLRSPICTPRWRDGSCWRGSPGSNPRCARLSRVSKWDSRF